jgi:hypothetical protein
MQRLAKYCILGSHFNDLAKVHDANGIAHVFDGRQVMGDEQVGEAQFLAQVLEQDCTDTSRAEVGSSNTMKLGLRAKAFATPILCLCPPLNSCG